MFAAGRLCEPLTGSKRRDIRLDMHSKMSIRNAGRRGDHYFIISILVDAFISVLTEIDEMSSNYMYAAMVYNVTLSSNSN